MLSEIRQRRSIAIFFIRLILWLVQLAAVVSVPPNAAGEGKSQIAGRARDGIEQASPVLARSTSSDLTPNTKGRTGLRDCPATHLAGASFA